MAYTIQVADLKEHQELLVSLWEKNYQGVNLERFSWIYENNPNGAPIVFLLKHEEGQSFVGAVALFPRPLFYRGRTIPSYICGDMVVDSEHRALGPALSLLKAAVKQCDKEDPCILVSFPNEKSKPVALRVGFKVLGDNCEFVKVLKTRDYLLRYCKTPILVDFISWPLDTLLRWRYEHFLGIRARGYDYDVLSEFDTRFDPLWSKIDKNLVFTGVRSRGYLNWRIKDSPYERCEIFVLYARKDKDICGYIAFHCSEVRANIVDLTSSIDTPEFNMLFHLFCKYMKNKGMHSISISLASSSSISSMIKKLGFSMRGFINNVVVYSSFDTNRLVEDILCGKWYLTPADNDI